MTAGERGYGREDDESWVEVVSNSFAASVIVVWVLSVLFEALAGVEALVTGGARMCAEATMCPARHPSLGRMRARAFRRMRARVVNRILIVIDFAFMQ